MASNPFLSPPAAAAGSLNAAGGVDEAWDERAGKRRKLRECGDGVSPELGFALIPCSPSSFGILGPQFASPFPAFLPTPAPLFRASTLGPAFASPSSALELSPHAPVRLSAPSPAEVGPSSKRETGSQQEPEQQEMDQEDKDEEEEEEELDVEEGFVAYQREAAEQASDTSLAEAEDETKRAPQLAEPQLPKDLPLEEEDEPQPHYRAGG
jgi:hypothetical protein